ncbi:hypothetical protein LRP88_06038 [Fusarium phalaenopsidis]
MVESFDIQNLLQTGYFTTSRAKSPKPQSSSQFEASSYSNPTSSYSSSYQSSYQQSSRPYSSNSSSRAPRVRPPPPFVEDEETSLKREHGAYYAKNPEDEPPSRGEIDQAPLIMEVHEYNPERRFVILTGSSSGSEGGETERKTVPVQPRQERVEKPARVERPERPERPERSERIEKPERVGRSERVERPERVERSERAERPERVERPARTERPERGERTERVERNERPERNERVERVERNEKPSSDTHADTRSSRRYDTNLNTGAPTSRDRSRPPLEKRRSRQDLPRLETEFRDDQLPEKYRSRPSAAASSRPDQPPVRPPKIPIDPPLPPEVIKHSAGGREKAYHSYAQPQSSSRRSPTRPTYSTNLPDDRRYDGTHTRTSSTASTSKRSNVEPEKPTRPLSKDRVGETPYRSEYVPPRTTKKERSPSYGRADREDLSRASTYPSRESATRRDDRMTAVMTAVMTVVTIVVTAVTAAIVAMTVGMITALVMSIPRDHENSTHGGKSLSCFRTNATHSPNSKRSTPLLGPGLDLDYLWCPYQFRFPLAPARSLQMTCLQTRGLQQLSQLQETYMLSPRDPRTNFPTPWTTTHLILSIPGEALNDSAGHGLATSVRPPLSSQPWQPPAFDPNRDGVYLEKPVGAVRRHSEHTEATGVTTFPECRRKHPVAGMVDWLTLPRTDFNICPDCYGAVFSKTEYRNPFQPMLRPTDRPIACDFGVGPWYRIAWLLTLKNNLPDLRLFHDVASVISDTKNIPCPGDRTTTRNWLTLYNPYTRQLVYDFTVCPQCARIIQALLPNLTGIFIPLDSRSEPTRGLCAMRFKPKRKRFVMYFDAMETTSDQARLEHEEPDLKSLAQEVERMAAVSECQEDTPIHNGYWHTMQFLRQFSVCGECFDEVVRPLINNDNVIARNFYMNPQRLPVATCQLYSPRMREIFQKACRWNDPKYLENKVIERMDIEARIHDKLAKLDRSGNDEEWVDEQVDKLIQEWKRWE